MDIRSDQYYVYHHVDDGFVFYIGMGSGGRAFDLSTHSRNKGWREYAAQIPGLVFTIRIVKIFDDTASAYAFENEQIIHYRPSGNIAGIPRPSAPQRKRIPVAAPMSLEDAGRLGARVTNKILTTETRKKAARKGWITRRKKKKTAAHV